MTCSSPTRHVPSRSTRRPSGMVQIARVAMASIIATPFWPDNRSVGTLVQLGLPAEYITAAPEDMERRILAARAALGSRLVILGHHYQRDEVIRHADFTGDSFRLAQLATTR